MLQLSALKSIKEKGLLTARRFPIPLLISVIAALSLWWMIDHSEKDVQFFNILHLIITLSLALPAFVGLNFFLQRGEYKAITHWIAHAILISLGVWYFFSIPTSFEEVDLAKYVIISLSMHLWVAFAPFVFHQEIQGFWQYNKSLFLRFLTAVLYSGVLFAGLALALFAVDQLFDVHMDQKNYARLWVFIATVFNTWFFLSDVPEEMDELNASVDYPKGLRVFTQFVLLPLVTIYLAILYVYMFKIIISGDWPNGWVSYLVIGFSTAGILALLLVWPLQNDPRFKWIKVYVRYFFLALFPLILMLAFAIYIRVKDYGITENRYFIIALAVWLFGNAVYFLMSSVKNIKVIPMSLFVVALCSGFGPWSAFSVSRSSQTHRLLHIADKYAMVKDSKIRALEKGKTMADSDMIEMSNVVYYLLNTHGSVCLQPLMVANLDSLSKSEGTYNLSRMVMNSWNLKFMYAYESEQVDQLDFSFNSDNSFDPIKVEGYAYYVSKEYYENNTNFDAAVVLDSSREVNYSFDKEKFELKLTMKGEEDITFKMQPFFDKLSATYSTKNSAIPTDAMSVVLENSSFKCKIHFKSLYGKYNAKKRLESIGSFNVNMLFVGK